MEDTTIIALGSVISFVFVQTAIFSFYIGKISNKIDTNKTDIIGMAKRHKVEIKTIRTDLTDDFKSRFNSNQEIWTVKLDGILEQREIRAKQDTVEHARLFKIVDKIREDLEKLLRGKT